MSLISRKLIAEFIGTFALVFAGCGAIIVDLHSHIVTHVGVALTFGLVIMTMIYAVGHISAAHFNPAVTIGFAIARRFPWRYVPHYILAECAGALVASILHWVIFGSVARKALFGATSPTGSYLTSFTLEIVLTFFLMFVIMAVATDKRCAPGVAGLAIGMTVGLCALFGGPISGASMNPARSLGPAIVAGIEGLKVLWIYLIAPPIGAIIASLAYEFIRGGEEFAKGAPDDLMVYLSR
ncbi:MAG TPA: MIP family channel protein [Armatimonadetes bacterium]|nr:MIP family channel protein [Armatimonadota bacterium]